MKTHTTSGLQISMSPQTGKIEGWPLAQALNRMWARILAARSAKTPPMRTTRRHAPRHGSYIPPLRTPGVPWEMDRKEMRERMKQMKMDERNARLELEGTGEFFFREEKKLAGVKG